MASLGFRAIAPDMRGYGRSSVPPDPSDYRVECIVGDLIGLLDAIGRDKAVFIGHDWGCHPVFQLAAHHPERCNAVACLAVGYRGLPSKDSIDPKYGAYTTKLHKFREGAEEDAGPYDYQVNYIENFDASVASLEEDIPTTVKATFRGVRAAVGEARTFTEHLSLFDQRKRMKEGKHPWFVNMPENGSPISRDPIISEFDLCRYTEGLQRNGLRGACSWYLNGVENAKYAMRSVKGGIIDLPVLFIRSSYDSVCTPDRYIGTMASFCPQLTMPEPLPCGHWIQQELPTETNALLVQWMATALRGVCWPKPRAVL
jgi:pimeloyl-ACP methyl ester carboxylesterase